MLPNSNSKIDQSNYNRPTLTPSTWTKGTNSDSTNTFYQTNLRTQTRAITPSNSLNIDPNNLAIISLWTKTEESSIYNRGPYWLISKFLKSHLYCIIALTSHFTACIICSSVWIWLEWIIAFHCNHIWNIKAPQLSLQNTTLTLLVWGFAIPSQPLHPSSI